jgi:LacI family transcriptional regulator
MVTITDVARHAGVSTATVSHVLNGTRYVSEETQARVLAAVNELGYRPNRLARSLALGETHTLGLIIPDQANPFFAELARGVEDTAFERGYNVILCNSYGDLDKELRYQEVLSQKQVDGILMVAAGASVEHVQDLQAQRIPLAIVDRDLTDASVDKVLGNNLKGGQLATNHLFQLGHRRIGCITGPSQVTPSSERVIGYRRVLEETGIALDQELIVRGDFQPESGYQGTRKLLALENAPTAIFACNDLMAIGVISAAAELGRSVPADLSVVGYDNISLSAFANPPLTTIVQSGYEQGALAVELLLERIQNPDLSPRREILDTHLLVRQSTSLVAECPRKPRSRHGQCDLPG